MGRLDLPDAHRDEDEPDGLLPRTDQMLEAQVKQLRDFMTANGFDGGTVIFLRTAPYDILTDEELAVLDRYGAKQVPDASLRDGLRYVHSAWEVA